MNSREFFVDIVASPKERTVQVQRNLMLIMGLVEHCILRLIRDDMSDEEKLYYYKTAAAVLEPILDGKYAGFYDTAQLTNYYGIVKHSMCMGDREQARIYVNKFIATLQKHLENEKEPASAFINDPEKDPTHMVLGCKHLLYRMLTETEFSPFKKEITVIRNQYFEKYPS